MSAPAPKRIGNADGDVRKLNEFCTNVSVDIYNYIKDLENRLTALQKGSIVGKVSATITDYASKASVVSADQTYIADSAAANAIKRVTIGVISTFINAVNALITTYTAKSPVTGADQVYIADSASGNAIKRATLTDVAAVANAVNATITTYAAKSPVAGADQAYIADSAAGNAIKRASLTDLAAVANAVNATITTYSAKSPVVGADQVYVADSAAGNAIKRATLTDVVALASSSYISPYVKTPASPNAFDDEFNEGGDPDLSNRGYTVTNSAGTTLTRSGNISPWDATGPVGNTYWSTLIGGWIFIQAANGVQVDIRKAITLSAGDTYFVRTSGTYNFSTSTNGRFNEIGFYALSGSALDGNNRVFSTVRDDTTAANYLFFDLGHFTGGGAFSGVSRLQLIPADIRGIRFDSGTSHYPFFVNSNGGQITSWNTTGTPAAGTLTNFGIRNLFSTSGTAVPQIWAIDFIRKKTSNAWLIP